MNSSNTSSIVLKERKHTVQIMLKAGGENLLTMKLLQEIKHLWTSPG